MSSIKTLMACNQVPNPRLLNKILNICIAVDILNTALDVCLATLSNSSISIKPKFTHQTKEFILGTMTPGTIFIILRLIYITVEDFIVYFLTKHCFPLVYYLTIKAFYTCFIIQIIILLKHLLIINICGIVFFCDIICLKSYIISFNIVRMALQTFRYFIVQR